MAKPPKTRGLEEAERRLRQARKDLSEAKDFGVPERQLGELRQRFENAASLVERQRAEQRRREATGKELRPRRRR
jgi:hypothetical protein